MNDYPSIVYGLIQGSVFVYYVIMLVSAARKGLHWVMTLVYGSLFGLIIEILLVTRDYPGYHYATDRFLCIKGAPIWVAMGWGIVAYACTRTAQRLQFKKTIWSNILWRPLAAGYLAVGIDITLDPVAQVLHFWTWHCDCILLSPDPSQCPVPCPAESSYPVHLLRYFDVPFDNFVGGWFGITATYSLSVFLVSMIHRWFTKSRPDADPTDRNRAIDWGVLSVPIFFHGVPIALLLFWAFRAQPALFLNVPANLALSLLLFTWPFQSLLKRRATALAATYRNRGIWAFIAALFDPRQLEHG